MRPWSRALCVHQGKGRDRCVAQIGALMEAVESHSAEAFAAPGFEATIGDLGPSAPSLAADDFACRRGELGPSSLVRWTPARRVADGGRALVPWWSVSLDMTELGDGRVERSSNGLAAGFDLERARMAALCELLERDAVAEWRAMSPTHRALSQVTAPHNGDDWLVAFVSTASACGVHLTLYAVASVIGWPVVVAVLDEPGAGRLRRARVFGSACRPGGAAAVEAAVCEAAQSRLTAISAVRDDILPNPGEGEPATLGLATPLPFHVAGRGAPVLQSESPLRTVADAAAVLDAQGFGPLLEVELPSPSPAVVVKLFAPGLAMADRRRRVAGTSQ